MSDRAEFFADLLVGWGDTPPGLPAIFQLGDRIAERGADPSGVPAGVPVQRVAVLGSATLDYLRRAVACAILREGVFPIVYQAPFGAYVQEILAGSSALHGFAADLAVIAPHWRDLVLDLPADAGAAKVDAGLAASVALFQTLWQSLAGRGVVVIQHALVPPAARYRGLADRLAPASVTGQVHRLNALLFQAGRGQVIWVDMPTLAAEIGTRRFSPARFRHAAGLDFDPKWLPDYLPMFAAAWRNATARARRVLVLDLDNTLWGGAIGDDGVDGIVLGAGSPAGEAFVAWQLYVRDLGRRGVVLAVCSKNDPGAAEIGFGHADSVLGRDDFAAVDCSWGDKVGGLRRIAAGLNLGLDSFVFCDDSAAECELVRRSLPEVAVVCLGAEASSFIDLFDAGYWFDTDGYTADDLGRSAAYGARAAALAERPAATDLSLYLTELAMRGSVRRAVEADVGRIAQLELKTNQFNVTTRRYTEPTIRGLLARDDAVVLTFRLADRFGDHGLTSALVAVRAGDTLRIDSWVTSCRVFSRSAEPFILRYLIGIAGDMGASRLVGVYLPTERNGVVAELFVRLGFMPAADGRFVREVGGPVDDLVTYIQG